jgi:polyisoprenoid-binding protein YceI
MKSRIKGWAFILLAAGALIAGCAAPAAATQSPTAAPQLPAPITGQEPTAELPADSPTPAPTLAPTEPPTAAAETTAIRYDVVNPDSKARYRVREQLANLTLPNDAVGETDQVTGAIVLLPDGTFDPAASQVVVDMASIASDSGRRDNFVRGNVLETHTYPQAVFVPKRAEGLPVPPPETGEVNFQLIGDLTIRAETREVAWTVTGAVEGGRAVGQATTSFTFADFNLTQPRVPIVLSIEDEIRLELDLVLQRSGGPAAAAEGAGQPAEAAAAPGFTCAAPAALTPALTEGPYYTPGAPERTSLWEAGVPGTRLLLTGYVLTADCQPVPGALLDFWQADGAGRYDNSGYVLRGIQYTDENGRYELETVIPGEYPGRTPHIHVKVQAPGGPLLTSQVFFPDAAQNQTDRIFDQGLLVTYLDPAGDVVQATFNFVIATQ